MPDSSLRIALRSSTKDRTQEVENETTKFRDENSRKMEIPIKDGLVSDEEGGNERKSKVIELC